MKNRITITARLALLASAAFNPGQAGWKLDDNGNVVLKDGNPVYVDANGGEVTMSTDAISRLNGEAKTLRTRAETAETKLKNFDGIEPEIARKAVETVGKLDAKKLIDAGEVDKVREQISQQFTTQIAEKDRAFQELQSKYDNSQIAQIFASSDFIRDRIAVPRDMFEASFRQNFKIEEGKISAYDKSGNRLMSKKTPGDYADPSEALELLVDMHPQKETILRAEDHSGTGNGGGGGARGGGRYIKRSDFEKLAPHKQQEIALKGETTITD